MQRDLQIFHMALDCFVLACLGCFRGRRGSSSSDGENDVEICEWVDNTTQPPCFVLDFCAFLQGEVEFARDYRLASVL